MKLILNKVTVEIIREDGDGRIKDESQLLYRIKEHLNARGGDFIKKRMHKDGHLTDDLRQYVRVRKTTGLSKQDIAIHNGAWAITDAAQEFNSRGRVTLNVERAIFGTDVRKRIDGPARAMGYDDGWAARPLLTHREWGGSGVGSQGYGDYKAGYLRGSLARERYLETGQIEEN